MGFWLLLAIVGCGGAQVPGGDSGLGGETSRGVAGLITCFLILSSWRSTAEKKEPGQSEMHVE